VRQAAPDGRALGGLVVKHLAVSSETRSQSYAKLVLCFVFYIRFGTACVTFSFLRPLPEIAKIFFGNFSTLPFVVARNKKASGGTPLQ